MSEQPPELYGSRPDPLESLADAFWTFDPAWRISYLNPAAERMIGHSRQELLGRSIQSDLPAILGVAVRAGKVNAIEHKWQDRCYELRCSPAKGGGASVFCIDITDRKRAAAELERSRATAERQLAELETIFQTAPIGLLFVDTDLRYVWVNQRMAEINGIPVEEHVGRTIFDVLPEIAGRVEPNYRAVIESGTRLIEREIRGHTPADPGVEHVFLVNYYPVRETGGRVVGVTAVVRDVTEQKQAEEALRTSEERFALFMRHLPGAAWMKDIEGRYVYANQEAERVFQLPLGSLIGKTDEEVFPAEIALQFRANDRLALSTGSPLQTTEVLPRPDGDHHSVVSKFAIPDAAGAAAIVGGIAIDVTPQRKAAEALRESERRFRTLCSHAPVGIFLTDRQGDCVLVNERWCEIAGMDAQEAMGRGWARAVHPDDRERVMQQLYDAIHHGAEFCAEHRFLKPGGKIIWVQGSMIALRNDSGEIEGYIGTLTDITSRKEAEDVVRRSERRFRALLENSADGIVVVDATGKVLYAGPPILGYDDADWIGRQTTDLIHPEDRKKVIGRFFTLVKNPGGVMEAEFRARHTDGSFRRVEVVAKNLLDDPDVGGIVLNYRDVTERKQFEEQLLQSQKLESLGVLAGGIAHDFNNLLVGMMGNASLAVEFLPPIHPVRPMIEEVLGASEKAAGLTHQLLAYSGKGRFVVDVIDLSELVKEMVGLVGASIPKNVQLCKELEIDLPCIEADVAQMQQLVMNLVINGAEALGGRPGTVTVSTSRLGEFVKLAVADTGCGMDEATKLRIFDPFFTTKTTGRGLGLAAVQGIVHGHQGTIEIDSVLGEGTTFTVRIPAVKARVSGKQPASREREWTGKGTILLVDDEQLVRRMARLALENWGYKTVLADNGEEAVKLFRQRPDIDLVILDVSMPVMGGEDCLRELQSIRPEVPVILSSGFNEADAIHRFPGSTLAGFIQKPYTARNLAEKVKQALTA